MQANLVRAGGLLSLLLCAAACAAQPLARAERPDVKTGESWVYREQDLVTGEKRDTSSLVTAVDADGIVTETGLSTSGAWTFTRDWNPVERRSGQVVSIATRPYWPFLQFPLEVGKNWDASFENEVTTKGGKRFATWPWKARVVGTEAVTVPAGTFQTFRIEYDGTYASRAGNRAWTGRHKETLSYAPEAKRFIRREFEQSATANEAHEHHVIELVSLMLAP
jgi:hypothetical protein